MFRGLFFYIGILTMAFALTADEKFIIENMEMLEAMDMLESDANIEELTADENGFALVDSEKAKHDVKEEE